WFGRAVLAAPRRRRPRPGRFPGDRLLDAERTHVGRARGVDRSARVAPGADGRLDRLLQPEQGSGRTVRATPRRTLEGGDQVNADRFLRTAATRINAASPTATRPSGAARSRSVGVCIGSPPPPSRSALRVLP